MGKLPTGTLTLLFTDIEGSTRLLDELGDGYADVLAEHHRLLREAFERHGGVEASTQGDSFFVVFSSATDAVAAAADAQGSLASGPVRVRMGLHTGDPRLTEEGYVGLDVHRAARIGAAGHGGQVVISETTQTLLDGEFDLRDLGEHRLKDLGAPIRLYQLGRDEFPPLRSLSQAQLPVEPAALLGRKRELGDLLRLLGRDRARLVTLTGPAASARPGSPSPRPASSSSRSAKARSSSSWPPSASLSSCCRRSQRSSAERGTRRRRSEPVSCSSCSTTSSRSSRLPARSGGCSARAPTSASWPRAASR